MDVCEVGVQIPTRECTHLLQLRIEPRTCINQIMIVRIRYVGPNHGHHLFRTFILPDSDIGAVNVPVSSQCISAGWVPCRSMVMIKSVVCLLWAQLPSTILQFPKFGYNSRFAPYFHHINGQCDTHFMHTENVDAVVNVSI